jgi:cell division inhibitor SepF
MGVRDHLERVAAWFGFGVDEDDYYEEEEDDGRRYAGKRPLPGRDGG